MMVCESPLKKFVKNMNKRIIIFSTFYDPFMSGAERMVKEVVERLSGRFDFFIVTARLQRDLPKKEQRKINDFNYTIVRIGLGLKIDKWLYPLLAPLYAIGLRASVVHAVMESYAGIALWLYQCLGGKKPTILTLQSGDLDMPEKVKTIPPWLWQNIHQTPSLVVGISSALEARAKHLGATKTLVIPNGVDFKKLEKIQKEQSKQPTISVVARLSKEKGLDDLIKSLPIIAKKIPDIRLVIVGDGNMRSELIFLAKDSGVAELVRFMGALPNDQAMREVARSSVFVLPSLGEGLGIVILEAQALGVPVVATNIGGIPDCVKDGTTGLLVPVKNPKAIAEAVIKILENQSLADTLVKNAKKELYRFDWQRIAEQYADIYHLL